jgi:hypothetical protein
MSAGHLDDLSGGPARPGRELGQVGVLLRRESQGIEGAIDLEPGDRASGSCNASRRKRNAAERHSGDEGAPGDRKLRSLPMPAGYAVVLHDVLSSS